MNLYKKVVGILAVLVLCILMEIEYSSGYIGFFTLIYLILLIGFCYVIFGLFHHKKRLFQGGGIIVFCLVEIQMSHLVIGYQRQMTYDAGERLIKGIEQFQLIHGNYPEHLSDLIPVYFDNVPKTQMGWHGRPFNYSVKGKNYSLSFDYHIFLICTYDSEFLNWHCDD